MSNSVWKTGCPKYEHDRSWDDIVQEYHREDCSKFYVVGSCSEPNDRWAYLTDIIAQADKAERLQKAVDYVYKLLLEEANFTAGVHLPNKYQQKIFEVIKQLTKE